MPSPNFLKHTYNQQLFKRIMREQIKTPYIVSNLRQNS